MHLPIVGADLASRRHGAAATSSSKHRTAEGSSEAKTAGSIAWPSAYEVIWAVAWAPPKYRKQPH
ncbi:hypothetical protein, partial [Bradyrhizobium pachyrhizi]|uniref:hypothetical protein n=1 Tax=Bradyrhizobium pachyrhizi TaxID=280333 RepID=UPI001AEC6AE9